MIQASSLNLALKFLARETMIEILLFFFFLFFFIVRSYLRRDLSFLKLFDFCDRLDRCIHRGWRGMKKCDASKVEKLEIGEGRNQVTTTRRLGERDKQVQGPSFTCGMARSLLAEEGNDEGKRRRWTARCPGLFVGEITS